MRSSSFHCTSSPGSKPMAAARARGKLTYLIKHTAVNSLCGAIREVHKGNTFFGPSIPCHLHKWNPKKLLDWAGLPKPRMRSPARSRNGEKVFIGDFWN